MSSNAPFQQTDFLNRSKSDFPPQAHLPSSHLHEPADEDDGGPTGVNSIQHVLRVAIADQGYSILEDVVSAYGSFERSQTQPKIDEFRDHLSDVDQYVETSLQPQLDGMESKLEEREQWYSSLINGEWGTSIAGLIEKARTISSQASDLTPVVVAHDRTIDTPDYVTRVLQPDEIHTSPEDFGYDLPHVFLAVNNGGKSGSIYPLIPWYGTVVCSCYAKQNKSFAPACKHEVFAAHHQAKQGAFINKKLPEPYRRIVSPYGRREYHDLKEWADGEF